MKKLLEPVAHWRLLPRTWSIRLAAIGTATLALIQIFPVNAYDIWASLPPEVKFNIPPRYLNFIGIALYVASMVSQFVRQRKLVDRLTKTEDKNNA